MSEPRIRLFFFPVLVLSLMVSLMFVSPAWSQIGVLSTYETEGEAEVKDENYVKGRRIALHRALRASLEKALNDLVGEAVLKQRGKTVRKMLAKPKKYVKSYRFLEASDDVIEKKSRVAVEVILFTDALNKELNTAGLVSSSVKEKTVVILIKERSFTSRNPSTFWDYVPISEVALVQNFVGAGINVIGRDQIFGAIREDSVVSAARGEVTSAVDIGLKAGADIVIVGSAVSAQVGKRGSGPITVRANLSMKAISSLRSVVIAAKSDFATARAIDPMNGELQAFEVVSKKMGTFLIDAIRRYWGPEPVAQKPGATESTPEKQAKPDPTPAPSAPSLPGMMDDL